jgi:hypothetical protein
LLRVGNKTLKLDTKVTHDLLAYDLPDIVAGGDLYKPTFPQLCGPVANIRCDHGSFSRLVAGSEVQAQLLDLISEPLNAENDRVVNHRVGPA